MARMMETDFEIDLEVARAVRDRITRRYLGGLAQAVREITRSAELALEQKTAEVGGGRLSKAWTSDSAPSRGPARNPSGWIRLNSYYKRNGRISRTYGAIETLTTTGRINAQVSGQWLAIPLPAAGARGRDRWLTPGEWERKTGLRLRYVYRGNKPPLLVIDEAVLNKRTGAARPSTRKRTEADLRRGYLRNTQTIPIFVLLPFVAHGQRFSIASVVGPYLDALADRARALSQN